MKTSKQSNRRQKRRGIATLWMAFMFMFILGLMAIMLDFGRGYMVVHQLHNAADAAALAGARFVPIASDPNYGGVSPRIIAQNYANRHTAAKLMVDLALNSTNADSGDIVIGRYYSDTGAFIATENTPNAMKVVARRDGSSGTKPVLGLMFGSLFGTDSASVERFAIAKVYNASGAAVIALNEDFTARKQDSGIYLHGNPAINIANGGSIYSNTLGLSAEFAGNSSVDVAEINVVGEINESINPSYEGLPTVINTQVPPIEDPYKNLLEPALAAVSPTAPADGSALKITGDTHTLQPGYYPGGIEITGGNITLASGIYQIGETGDSKNEGGLSMNGGIINADQVMFHVVGGKVDIRGNTQLTLTPPTAGTYDGISLFQSRDNYLDAEINGGGYLNMTGALYFPENKLWVTGDGDTIGTQLIADTIEIAGTGAINIPWNGTPEIVNQSYLVK
ncbi:MAG: hypothetical protein DRP56_07415 [Planctomycetota bacterium]|nr:MAG: hypothetical protein DRP56_07415 [Planctomycetota bacterium]